MRNKLTAPHRHGEGEHRDAETGSPALNTPHSANRASRAIDADRSVPGPEPRLVAGVDSVPRRKGDGWVMAVTATHSGAPVKFLVWGSFADLWGFAREQRFPIVAVDMPVGLPGAGGRTADRDGRGWLRPKRTSCVFPAPALCILNVDDFDLAKRMSYEATGKMPTQQAHALLRKIREVRHAVNDPNNFYRSNCSMDSAPTWAVEVHPEVSFAKLAGEPIPVPKHRQSGVVKRLEMLQTVFPNIEDAMTAPVVGRPRPGRDDRLDAAAAAWTARQLVKGDADCLGAGEDDATGYPMNIWV